MIFTKADTSNSDEKVDNLTKEFNIHYRACICSLIHLLSTRVSQIFVVHKLEKFSENPRKVKFEGLVHLLRYIRDNKTLGLKYYDNINDAPVSGIQRQDSIKTENQFKAFSDSSWQEFPDTGRSTGEYIIFYQGGKLTIAHIFQDQFLNQLQKVSTMQNELQEWIQHISIQVTRKIGRAGHLDAISK